MTPVTCTTEPVRTAHGPPAGGWNYKADARPEPPRKYTIGLAERAAPAAAGS
jgi:hypothetical protein